MDDLSTQHKNKKGTIRLRPNTILILRRAAVIFLLCISLSSIIALVVMQAYPAQVPSVQEQIPIHESDAPEICRYEPPIYQSEVPAQVNPPIADLECPDITIDYTKLSLDSLIPTGLKEHIETEVAKTIKEHVAKSIKEADIGSTVLDGITGLLNQALKTALADASVVEGIKEIATKAVKEAGNAPLDATTMNALRLSIENAVLDGVNATIRDLQSSGNSSLATSSKIAELQKYIEGEISNQVAALMNKLQSSASASVIPEVAAGHTETEPDAQEGQPQIQNQPQGQDKVQTGGQLKGQDQPQGQDQQQNLDQPQIQNQPQGLNQQQTEGQPQIQNQPQGQEQLKDQNQGLEQPQDLSQPQGQDKEQTEGQQQDLSQQQGKDQLNKGIEGTQQPTVNDLETRLKSSAEESFMAIMGSTVDDDVAAKINTLVGWIDVLARSTIADINRYRKDNLNADAENEVKQKMNEDINVLIASTAKTVKADMNETVITKEISGGINTKISEGIKGVSDRIIDLYRDKETTTEAVDVAKPIETEAGATEETVTVTTETATEATPKAEPTKEAVAEVTPKAEPTKETVAEVTSEAEPTKETVAAETVSKVTPVVPGATPMVEEPKKTATATTETATKETPVVPGATPMVEEPKEIISEATPKAEPTKEAVATETVSMATPVVPGATPMVEEPKKIATATASATTETATVTTSATSTTATATKETPLVEEPKEIVEEEMHEEPTETATNEIVEEEMHEEPTETATEAPPMAGAPKKILPKPKKSNQAQQPGAFMAFKNGEKYYDSTNLTKLFDVEVIKTSVKKISKAFAVALLNITKAFDEATSDTRTGDFETAKANYEAIDVDNYTVEDNVMIANAKYRKQKFKVYGMNVTDHKNNVLNTLASGKYKHMPNVELSFVRKLELMNNKALRLGWFVVSDMTPEMDVSGVTRTAADVTAIMKDLVELVRELKADGLSPKSLAPRYLLESTARGGDEVRVKFFGDIGKSTANTTAAESNLLGGVLLNLCKNYTADAGQRTFETSDKSLKVAFTANDKLVDLYFVLMGHAGKKSFTMEEIQNHPVFTGVELDPNNDGFGKRGYGLAV